MKQSTIYCFGNVPPCDVFGLHGWEVIYTHEPSQVKPDASVVVWFSHGPDHRETRQLLDVRACFRERSYTGTSVGATAMMIESQDSNARVYMSAKRLFEVIIEEKKCSEVRG